MIGAIKVERVAKTKFRKHNESNREQQQPNKQKHHDRSFYRLMKEEQEYVYSPSNTKANNRD
jgi:hypothetical protein